MGYWTFLPVSICDKGVGRDIVGRALAEVRANSGGVSHENEPAALRAVCGAHAKMPSSRIVETLQEGDGVTFPKQGDKVLVHYTGCIASTGSAFDSSRARGHAFTFILGCGKVIQGWDDLVRAKRGMGSARRTHCAPHRWRADQEPPFACAAGPAAQQGVARARAHPVGGRVRAEGQPARRAAQH